MDPRTLAICCPTPHNNTTTLQLTLRYTPFRRSSKRPSDVQQTSSN